MKIQHVTVVSALRMEQRTQRESCGMVIFGYPSSDRAEFSEQGMLLGHKEQSLK